MKPKTIIVYIATGPYKQYFEGFIGSLQNFQSGRKKAVFVLSDNITRLKEIPEGVSIYYRDIEHQHWPLVALNKFRYIKETIEGIKLDPTFEEVTEAYYFDSKVQFIRPLDFIFKTKSIVACPHIAWEHSGRDCMAFTWGREINPRSKAHIPLETKYTYCQSGVLGGDINILLQAASEIDQLTKEDLMHNIIPMWHDESYWNKWILSNQDKIMYLPSGSMGEKGDETCDNQEATINLRKTDEIQQLKQSIYES